jgi:hypothetical protein
VSDGAGAIVCAKPGRTCRPWKFVPLPFAPVRVLLIARAAAGYRFDGWSGYCTGFGPRCPLTLTQNTVVHASFARIGGVGAPQTFHIDVIGSGAIMSSPSRVECTAICDRRYALGTAVTFQAIPEIGYTVGGWGGECAGRAVDEDTCTVTIPAGGASVEVSFDPRYSLTVALNGRGAVTFNPIGTTEESPSSAGSATCAAADVGECTNRYQVDTEVTLTAHAAPDSRFIGWGIARCRARPTCVVTIDQYQYVTANFSPLPLYVRTAGSGVVIGASIGITCGSVCNANVPAGQIVTLTAVPASGRTFKKWHGCTSVPAVPATCRAMMSVARAVTAKFSDAPNAIGPFEIVGSPFKVVKVGTAGGSVTTDDGYIDCGAGCPSESASYRHGDTVTLHAHRTPGWHFARWSWQCLEKIRKTTCVVLAGNVVEVDATFVRNR